MASVYFVSFVAAVGLAVALYVRSALLQRVSWSPQVALVLRKISQADQVRIGDLAALGAQIEAIEDLRSLVRTDRLTAKTAVQLLAYIRPSLVRFPGSTE
jgi:hypothetical protein